MATFHISEMEAGQDFPALMEKVRAGAEVVIESDARPVAVLSPANTLRGRLLSESIALAQARAKERGYGLVMDDDFAADVMARIASRKPRDTSAWDETDGPDS
jgi:antitoxin (DNA-binding transcriptional repressor) of toxin-antitoxin stability system